MSEEPFLARWSRRKREGVKDAAQDAAHESKPADATGPTDVQPAASAGRESESKTEAPAFDPASLPPIESIGADTNIRAFLAEGVPAEIKRAALRRVWTADPAIRDFVGLQENDWDFTKPETIPGFGRLAADYDVEGMVRSVFGDPTKIGVGDRPVAAVTGDKAEIPAQAHEVSQEHPPADEIAQIEGRKEKGQSEATATDSSVQPLIVQRERHAAAQTEMTQGHDRPARVRRPHGGALPRDFPDHKRDS